jgi:hypothetical protein
VRVFEVFGPIIAEESFVKEPSRKYGFVRFASREDAERAKADMNHKVLGSRPIRIGWGDSNFEKHCVHIQFDPHACHLQTGLNVNAIFTEQFFLDTFTPFAKAHDTAIVNISLPKHSHTKKLKGFAFIHFEENEQGEKAAVLALQTLTNHVDASPQMQAVGAGANIPASNPMTYVHHLQQSFSPRQGAGHHAPPSHQPNNNTQQHVLGGIPVKYSFGKRQIFSRHKRANENHQAALAANHGLQSMQSNMAMMMQGINSGGYSNSDSNHSRGGHSGGGRGGGLSGGGMQHRYHRGNNNNIGGQQDSGRGGYSQGGSSSSAGGYGSSSNYYNQQSSGGGLQTHQSAYGAASQLSSVQSRYHTNPLPPSSSYSTGVSSLQPHHSSNSNDHHVGSTATTQAQHAAAAQAQAAEATRWMIASLAAQQYGQGASPMSVQQVQQAYTQIQQQATQAAASPTQSAAFLHGGSQEIAASAVGGDGNDAATSLASAANAFFNAQQQLYFSQISQQAANQNNQQQQLQQQNTSHVQSQSSNSLNSLSHPSPSSMEALMSEMSKLGMSLPNTTPSASHNNAWANQPR